MKGILIVDDSKTNRMVLDAVISDFFREAPEEKCPVFEAENGQQAIERVQSESIDFVFMDIMMPIMDGIEATKLIKEHNKKIMVVAVSAMDDEESKKKILGNGAEDYIVKPISAEVVRKRMHQYAMLVGARQKKRFSSRAANLFESRIYRRCLVFFIEDEGALSEFWEYFLAGDRHYREEITDLVRIIYGFAAWQLKLKHVMEIKAEEGETHLYLTLNNMRLLKAEIVENVINKNYSDGVYKLEDDKLSFAFKLEEDEPVAVESPKAVVDSQPADKVEVSDVEIEKAEEELQVFQFMDPEDQEELESVFAEINSLMLLVGSSTLDQKDALQIAAYLEKFGRLLNQYPETYDLYAAINRFAQDISENSHAFVEKSNEISLLCVGFNKDLGTWIQKLFYEGAPSINFLDNSIISNATMISGFINPQQLESEESVDDIFDF